MMTTERHEISINPVQKMDAHAPLHRWVCSCGKTTEAMFSTEPQALRAGEEHRNAKLSATRDVTGKDTAR